MTAKPREFIRRFDERYCLPDDVEVVKVIGWERVANEDGGTNWHWEYICIVREVFA